VAAEHGVQAEGALAFGDDVDRAARLVMQLHELGGHPVAEFRQGEVVGGRTVAQRVTLGVQPEVGELAHHRARHHGVQAVPRVAAR